MAPFNPLMSVSGWITLVALALTPAWLAVGYFAPQLGAWLRRSRPYE